jgi:hypothetical protein
MTLRLALCFLFHQNLGEHAARASRVCYRRVVDVLRNHPRMKFNLMLSGTLLDALGWFDPPLLDAVRSGLADGTFRLLGSTYAHSLLRAGDGWDNAHQIGLHRRTLKDYFSVEPEAFWSPQGTWSSDWSTLLVQSGYRVLPLESGTLRSAGAEAPYAYRIPSGGDALKILWEDPRLRDRLVFASWFHRPEVFGEVLEDWKARPDAARLFPVCAEDAGAFGLRAYDSGLDPRADADGLDGLLDWIERAGYIECAFLDQAPEPIGRLDTDPSGWRESLDRALANPDAPGHEEGYRDWADFLDRAPRLRHFRKIHGAARLRMLAAENALEGIAAERDPGTPPPAGAKIFALAERVYCAHQDGFGNVGVGGRGDPSWEGIGAAIAVAKAAELACVRSADVGQGIIDDLTGDGEDEILLRGGDQLAILSPYGGRLLYWIDLRQGRLHVGNPLAVPVGSLLIEARSPEFATLPDDWLPAETDPVPERKPDGGERRLVWLAGEHLPEYGGPLPSWPRPRSTALKPALPARRRALNDFFSLDDGPEEPPEPHLDFRLADGAATFLRFFGYRLRMVKRVSLMERGVRVAYRFHNGNARPIRVNLRLVSEVCPDYPPIMDSSGSSLRPVSFGPRRSPGILNQRTGNVLVSHASRPTSEPASFQPAVLAWEVTQTFSLTIEPDRAERIILRLSLYPATRFAAGSSSA